MVVKNKIPKDWLEKFFEKSGDDVLYTDNLTITDFGFASFEIKNNAIVILQVYGDGKMWDKFFVELAKTLNVNKIKMATKRNPRVFERKYGYKTVGYIMEKEVK